MDQTVTDTKTTIQDTTTPESVLILTAKVQETNVDQVIGYQSITKQNYQEISEKSPTLEPTQTQIKSQLTSFWVPLTLSNVLILLSNNYIKVTQLLLVVHLSMPGVVLLLKLLLVVNQFHLTLILLLMLIS